MNNESHALDVARGLRLAAGFFLFLCLDFVSADTLLDPSEFLARTFDDGVPDASLLWLTGDRGKTVTKLLGHRPASLRVRYWASGDRTAWILEEIGREQLITAGFVVEGKSVVDVQVLAFRETRGWEIKHDFFTRQFDGATLVEDHTLSKPVDNITGATLSVNAMKRMASLALYLHAETRNAAP